MNMSSHSPFPLYSPPALRDLEARGAALLEGDAFVLMARAGQAAWRTVLRHWPQAMRIVVACGPGNNGGDGYVLARHAHEAGRGVRVLRLAEPASELARRACADYLAAGGIIGSELGDAELIVDALFGIGLARAPDPTAAALIDAINAHPAPVLALDVPTGIDAAIGSAPGAAVDADCTLQFIARHRGLRTGTALDHCGELELAASQWVFFESALRRPADEQGMSAVATTSERLLSVMDRLTGLYEAALREVLG